MIDAVRIAFSEGWGDVLNYFDGLGWLSLLVFLPFLLLDLRRFLCPPLTLLALRQLGLPRDRTAAQRRFLATRPKVSVILAGYNEEAAVVPAITSLVETGFPNMEIIVVDDGSEDATFSRALPYAERGQIRLFKNASASGRGGKPSAINLGLRFASGEIIVFLDMDTSFDRDMFSHLIGPFYDPAVAVVAGNLKVRNQNASFWTRMQAIEYLIAIGLHRRWLDLFGTNYIASGACGAYRRDVLESFQGCDVTTAEDLDNTLKARRGGWGVVFAAEAIATTDVPEDLRTLIRQRIRWDRDLVRVAFRKHRDLLNARRTGWRLSLELWQVLFISVIANLFYAVYAVFMLLTAPLVFIALFAVCMAIYALMTVISIAVSLVTSERRSEERILLAWAPLLPLYNEVIFRWVRIYATAMELLRLNQQDAYLPQSAWRNARF